MANDQMRKWLMAFRDEDTESWIEASMNLGGLGPEAEPLLDRYLSQDQNIHAHRHAWCVLAAELDAMLDDDGELKHQDPEPVFYIIKKLRRKGAAEVQYRGLPAFVAGIAAAAVIQGLQHDPEIRLQDLERMTGFSAKRRATIERLHKQMEQMKAHGREQQAQTNQPELDRWENDRTPLASLKVKPSAKMTLELWTFSSLVAGLTPRLLRLLGIPLDLFTRALNRLGASGGYQMGYLASLPRVLIREQSDETRGLVEQLRRETPQTGGNYTAWVEYLQLLDRCARGLGLESKPLLPEYALRHLDEDVRQAYEN